MEFLKKITDALRVALERVKNEPVAVMTIVEAGIFFALEMGFDITMEAQAAILALVAAVLTLFTRSKVTPTRKLKA